MTNERDARLTPEQLRMVREIRRIADKLDSKTLSKKQFDEDHELGGVTTAGMQFGSWNDAVIAAGLEPNSAVGGAVPQYTDRDLLAEVIRVHREIGKPPPERRFAAMARFSVKPYRDRWGSFTKARAAAYEMFGTPDIESDS